MEHFDDSFALLPAGQEIATSLVENFEEFGHLQHARIAVVGSARTVWLHGAPCQALIAEPKVQGTFRLLFEWCLASLCAPLFDGEDPDFVVLVDQAIWSGHDAERRERLMYHELCHVVQRTDENDVPRLGRDGRPLLKLVPHDYETFDAEIRRYGVEVCGLEALPHAIVDGEARKKRRTLRIA